MIDFPTDADLQAAAQGLVTGLLERPLGTLSPSVYETARLVAVAPWLPGHATRVRFLVETQQRDGSWGDPGPARDGYGLVPTLSATEALLGTLLGDGGAPAGVDRAAAVSAVDRGLRRLVDWLERSPPLPLPDTCAIEVIVPALVERVHGLLARLDHTGVPGLEVPAGTGGLRAPAEIGDATYRALATLLRSGTEVPAKVRYVLEVEPEAARGAAGVQPVVPPGTVGASPAATAAWLGPDGMTAPNAAPVRYLRQLLDQFQGLAPTVLPVDVFERVMVLSTLTRAGLDLRVPPALVGSLRATLGTNGTPGGAGLPTDSDSTSLTLYTLSRLGVPEGVDRLFVYEQPFHFNTWDDGKPETTSSVSVNGHVLEALGDYVRRHPGAGARHASAIAKAAAWLCAQQADAGYWRDKWHASRYYATACAALPLHAYCSGRPRCDAAVDRAVDWVVATQRDDGSWGRWDGNVEETGYAMHVLLLARAARLPPARAAVDRGYGYLLERTGHRDDPALWYGKDLYALPAVTEAFRVATLFMLRSSRAAGAAPTS